MPPPHVDVIHILKHPTLFNKPLYGDDESNTKAKEDDDFDEFCKAMGWTQINGVLPVKPANKEKKRWEQENFDLTDVHKDFTKTNVEKEMKTNVLTGIQKKREVKELSEREAHRQRKVSIFCLSIFHIKNTKK